MRPTRVLFVCTANISRSPYAQYRTAEMFGDQLEPVSAGVPGTEGHPMDPAMEAELPSEDPGAIAHRSRVLTERILLKSDLVLTMEFSHHMRVLDQWPEVFDKTFGLSQFVSGLSRLTPMGTLAERIAQVRAARFANSMTGDIADPYRRGSRAARACARELDGLVRKLGRGLGYEPVPED